MQKTMIFVSSSQPEGADISDHGHLGSGVQDPRPGTGPQHVQPFEKAVWWHRWTAQGLEV